MITRTKIAVFYWGRGKKEHVGSLSFTEKTLVFEYAQSFRETGLEISPLKLPLGTSQAMSNDRLFDGLFGVFNDSVPDGWSRLLLDRALLQKGINPTALTPLDRLQYVGSGGMGALTYEPEYETPFAAEERDLDTIAAHALSFYEYNESEFVDELLAMSGSTGGARPKIALLHEGQEWIVKFRATIDRMDNGPLEYAYHLMAHAAGLRLPAAQLFVSRTGPGYFGCQRFDRIAAADGHSQRVHMHTISGLLHADHRVPSLDYETIIKATAWLTQSTSECVTQFRAAVFNVLAHNRDDHAKNFSFLMDHTGKWSVSPAYDLTFSGGPGGEHCTTVMGEGKNPTRTHLIQLGAIAGLSNAQTLIIIDEVANAVSQWRHYANQAGVSTLSRDSVASILEQRLKSA